MNPTLVALAVIILQQGVFALMWGLLAVLHLGRRSAWRWSVGNLLVSAGLGLIAMRSDLPVWIGFWVSNALILVGMSLIRGGVEVFAKLRPDRREHVWLWVGSMSVLALVLHANSPWLVVVVTSLSLAWVMARAGRAIQRHLAAEMGERATRWFASMFFGLTGVLAARASVAALRPEWLGDSLHTSSSMNTTAVLLFLTCGLVLNLCLVSLLMSRLVRRLQHQGDHDELTGLFNRRAIEQRLREEGLRLARYRQPFSVLSFDVDHFKGINDRFGHPVGDQVLRALGATVHQVCRASDVAGRAGGEEFWIVMPGTDRRGALHLAERLLQAVRQLRVAELAADCTLSVSIGVAVADNPAESHEARLQRMDAAMYGAKRKGRNRIELALEPSLSAAL